MTRPTGGSKNAVSSFLVLAFKSEGGKAALNSRGTPPRTVRTLFNHGSTLWLKNPAAATNGVCNNEQIREAHADNTPKKSVGKFTGHSNRAITQVHTRKFRRLAIIGQAHVHLPVPQTNIPANIMYRSRIRAGPTNRSSVH